MGVNNFGKKINFNHSLDGFYSFVFRLRRRKTGAGKP